MYKMSSPAFTTKLCWPIHQTASCPGGTWRASIVSINDWPKRSSCMGEQDSDLATDGAPMNTDEKEEIKLLSDRAHERCLVAWASRPCMRSTKLAINNSSTGKSLAWAGRP